VRQPFRVGSVCISQEGIHEKNIVRFVITRGNNICCRTAPPPAPKGCRGVPHINHPIALAHLLATVCGVEDLNVLRAAIIHDTGEDTETTKAEIRERFGDDVAKMVMEVTDDTSLPKQRRKELQVENAPRKSHGARAFRPGTTAARPGAAGRLPLFSQRWPRPLCPQPALPRRCLSCAGR